MRVAILPVLCTESVLGLLVQKTSFLTASTIKIEIWYTQTLLLFYLLSDSLKT